MNVKDNTVEPLLLTIVLPLGGWLRLRVIRGYGVNLGVNLGFIATKKGYEGSNGLREVLWLKKDSKKSRGSWLLITVTI